MTPALAQIKERLEKVTPLSCLTLPNALFVAEDIAFLLREVERLAGGWDAYAEKCDDLQQKLAQAEARCKWLECKNPVAINTLTAQLAACREAINDMDYALVGGNRDGEPIAVRVVDGWIKAVNKALAQEGAR